MIANDKIYYLPGDIVTLRQDIPNRPTMLVVKKVKSSIRVGKEIKNDFFQGILCRWFTSDGLLQEAVFNTKDLLML